MSGMRILAVALFIMGALLITNITFDFSNVIVGLGLMIGAALVFVGR